MIGSKPVFQTFGKGYLAVTGDELVKGHLFGRNRGEAVVGPLGIAQVHEDLPLVILVAGPVV